MKGRSAVLFKGLGLKSWNCISIHNLASQWCSSGTMFLTKPGKNTRRDGNKVYLVIGGTEAAWLRNELPGEIRLIKNLTNLSTGSIPPLEINTTILRMFF